MPSPGTRRCLGTGEAGSANRAASLEMNIDLFGEKSWTLADLAQGKDGRSRTRLLRGGGDAARVWE
jgi:hypothetical protein